MDLDLLDLTHLPDKAEVKTPTNKSTIDLSGLPDKPKDNMPFPARALYKLESGLYKFLGREQPPIGSPEPDDLQGVGLEKALEMTYWPALRALEVPISEVGTAIQEGRNVPEALGKAGKSYVPFTELDEPKRYADLLDNYYSSVTGQEAPDWYKQIGSVVLASGIGIVAGAGIKAAKAKIGKTIATRPATLQETEAIQKNIGDPIRKNLKDAGIDPQKLSDKGAVLTTKTGKVFSMNEDAVAIVKGKEVRVPRGAEIKPGDMQISGETKALTPFGKEVNIIKSTPPTTTPTPIPGQALAPKEVAKTSKLDAKELPKIAKEIAAIEDRKIKVETARESLTEVNELRKELKGRLNPYEGGYLKEELQGIPKYYMAKKKIEGISIDEAMEELRNKGIDISDEVDLKNYLINLDSAKAELLATIESEKIGYITKKETTLLKDKIRNIQTGLREGASQTKKTIKEVQGELVDVIKDSGLNPEDKAKFIETIKNIQTPEQLEARLPEIAERIGRLGQASEKRDLKVSIDKELKKTKPLKKGQKKVGRYDYESNKLFDELRRISKLSQAKAGQELDSLTSGESEADFIKMRLLSLKYDGAEASVELYKKVLDDIKRLKKIGADAADEIAFQKAVDRQEMVDEVLSGVAKIKGDKNSILTKIENAYRRGFSNIGSMLQSIAGKDIAARYNPELQENAKNTNIYYKTKAILGRASEIYDTKDPVRLFQSMGQRDYKITDLDGLTTEINKSELIDIYNSLKNSLTRERYFKAFGEAQINSLLGNLTVADKNFGDLLQEQVQEYRSVLNERHIEITGRDLGFVENYWPATSEFQPNIFDDIRVQGETPSAMKERTKSSNVIPRPQDAWTKAQRHIAQGEHVANLSREYEMLKRTFRDRKVAHSITQKFGENVYKTLMQQVDNISLNKAVEKMDAVSGAFKQAINNWVTAKVAINPSTYVRQLMSVGNYMENMNSVEWTKGFFEGISSPKETLKFMWDNAPFLEARFNKGYSEALVDALEGAKKLSAAWHSWTEFLSVFSRSGDITAIVYGGYPMVKADLAKGKSIEEAMAAFEQATLKAQQSGLSSSLSEFQNSKNPFARLFLAFKNTANQYFRKMVDATISFRNGEMPGDQYAKTMSIYGIIQPLLYVLAGALVTGGVKRIGEAIRGEEPKDEDFAEDLYKEIFINIVVNPINAIPVIDDLTTYAMRKRMGQSTYKVLSLPLLDDVSMAMQKINKKEPSAEDYLVASGAVLEPVTAAPIGTFVRLFNYAKGDKKGKKRGGWK